MQKVIILFSILLAACATPTALAPTATNVPPATTAPSATSVPSNTAVPSNLPTKAILMSAHRGGAGLAPENTLASFRNGLTFNPDFLEMDVHLSKDGAIMVMHDATIDRTTDGRGKVGDFTLAELQNFNAAAKFSGATSKEPVPTLAQVLDLAKPTKAGLEVEIKVGADGKPYPGIAKKVLDEINAHGMLDRVRIMAFEFDTLKEIRALDPKVTTIALMTTDYFRGKDISKPDAIIADVAPFASGIGVDKNYLTPALTNAAHNQKMLVGVWTVDTESDMQKFITMGVDSITTNRPDLLKKVLGR